MDLYDLHSSNIINTIESLLSEESGKTFGIVKGSTKHQAKPQNLKYSSSQCNSDLPIEWEYTSQTIEDLSDDDVLLTEDIKIRNKSYNMQQELKFPSKGSDRTKTNMEILEKPNTAISFMESLQEVSLSNPDFGREKQEQSSIDYNASNWELKYHLLFEEFQNLRNKHKEKSQKWKLKKQKLKDAIVELKSKQKLDSIFDPSTNCTFLVEPSVKSIILSLKKELMVSQQSVETFKNMFKRKSELFLQENLDIAAYIPDESSKLPDIEHFFGQLHKHVQKKMRDTIEVSKKQLSTTKKEYEKKIDSLLLQMKEKDTIICQLNSSLEVVSKQVKSLTIKLNDLQNDNDLLTQLNMSSFVQDMSKDQSQKALPTLTLYPLQYYLQPIIWRCVVPSPQSIWLTEALWKFEKNIDVEEITASFALTSKKSIQTDWGKGIKEFLDAEHLVVDDVVKEFITLSNESISVPNLLKLVTSLPEEWIIHSYYSHQTDIFSTSSDDLLFAFSSIPFTTDRIHFWVLFAMYKELRSMISNALMECTKLLQELCKGSHSWNALLKSILCVGNIFNQENTHTMGCGFSLDSLTNFLNIQSHQEGRKTLISIIFHLAESLDSTQTNFVNELSKNVLISQVINIRTLLSLVSDLECVQSNIIPFILRYGKSHDTFMLSDSICTDLFIEKANEIRNWIACDLSTYNSNIEALKKLINMFLLRYNDPMFEELQIGKEIVQDSVLKTISHNKSAPDFNTTSFQFACKRIFRFWIRWTQHAESQPMQVPNLKELLTTLEMKLNSMTLVAEMHTSKLLEIQGLKSMMIVERFDKIIKNLSQFVSEYYMQKEYIVTSRDIMHLRKKIQEEKTLILSMKQMKNPSIKIIQTIKDHTRRLKRYLDEYDDLTSKIDMLQIL